jgi:hypothetical protein
MLTRQREFLFVTPLARMFPRLRWKSFLPQGYFRALKACAEVVQSRWESFGLNVHENWKNPFAGMYGALIRSCAWKSTSHLTQKFSPGLRAAMFSTNPQPSSQQQGSKFCF